MILGSKAFLIPKGSTPSLSDIEDWINGIDRKNYDCRLMASLETVDKKLRLNKAFAKRQLEAYFLAHKNSWIKGDYEFYFDVDKFYWKGKEIYFTVGEQYFLYTWLILKEDICERHRYFLAHKRKRLGKDFLADVKDIADGGCITVEQLKRLHESYMYKTRRSYHRPSFFSKTLLSVFGDTLDNFGVRDAGFIEVRVKTDKTNNVENVDVWELLRKEPVKGVPSGHCAYFRKDNGAEILEYDVV